MISASAQPSFGDAIQTVALAATVAAAVWATIQQLRAYLGVSSRWVGPSDFNMPLEIEGAGRYGTKIFVTNHGKTPARNVRVRGACEVLPATLYPDQIRAALDIVPSNPRNLVPRVCDPNSALPLFYHLRGAGAPREPGPNDRIYKFGVITYSDIFGFERCRRFASYWDPQAVEIMGSGWVTADQHNEVD